MDQQLVTIAVVVAFFMPNAIAVINRHHWTSEVKAIVAFALCAAAAVVSAWFEDKLNTEDLRTTFLIVFGGAQAMYHLYYKPSGITDAIEKKTG